MPQDVLRLEGLTKVYRGGQVGISDLDLVARPGEVLGFLGPNGAGKTTTMRLLLDLIRPTRGSATVLGMDARRQGPALRAQVGYLPGDLALYPTLTGAETARFVARMRGTGPEAAVTLAARLDLDLGRRVRDLSKGNRQKLGLVLALAHRPLLAVLDEPTSGLDPVGQQQFQELVREAGREGRSVLLSSHVLSEVEHAADRVAILRAGRLAVVEDVDALRLRARRRLDLELGVPVPADAFAGLPGVEVVERGDRDSCRVAIEVAGPVGPAMRRAADLGLRTVTSHEPDLEQVFLDYVSGGGPSAAA